MKLLRKIALLWMFAWLPASGVMATTMPFCAQSLGGLMRATAVAENLSAMPCHEGSVASDTLESTLPIEHCDLCHLAGALAVPSLPFVANAAPGVAPLDGTASDFRSWVPDPLQHPPLPAPV